MIVSKNKIGLLIAIIALISFSCGGEEKPDGNLTDSLNGVKGGSTSTTAPGGVLAHWSQIIGNDTSTNDVMPLKLVARFILQGSGQKCTNYSLKPISKNGNPSPANPAT